MSTHAIIQTLTARIVEECKPVDREAAFDAMLDECYSFKKVGGPFEWMLPSRVLQEMDPTAYRCGVNDFADGEPWVEIDGETYDRAEVEAVIEEFKDGLESELSDLESELEELTDNLGDMEADELYSLAECDEQRRLVNLKTQEVTDKQAEIAAVTRSFDR